MIQRIMKRLNQFPWDFRNLFASKALILVYHRVAHLERDPWQVAVSPAHFAEQMTVLRRFFKPVRLSRLVADLRRGRVEPGSVAVTFDDAYPGVLEHALPVLTRERIPAVVFVVSGALKSSQEFYWDDLERILFLPPNLPSELRLIVAGEQHTAALGSPVTEEARTNLYHQMWQVLRTLSVTARQEAISQLADWSGAGSQPRPGYRPLDVQHLQALMSGGLVELGAHTVSHPSLAALPLEEQEQEIRCSKEQVEAAFQTPVNHFAYPYGKAADFTLETARLVKAAGFESACANYAGPITRASDPYQLPRLYVEDWDGAGFFRRVVTWMLVGGTEA